MKIYCGIFQDGLEIKLAFVKRHGKSLSVLKLLSVPSIEHRFVFSSEKSKLVVDSDINLEIGEIDESLPSDTFLREILSFYSLENLKFVPVVTEPQISYLVHHLSSKKKNGDLKSKLVEAWKENIGIEVPIEKLDFLEYRNHSIVSVVMQNEIPVLKELTALSSYSEIKSLDILPIRSGDISLVNYVLKEYQPNNEEVFLITYIGIDSVRLIFIKDGQIVHINRYLSLNSNQQGLVGFLSSKIVLEMEYSGINELTNILITGEVNDDLLSAFRQSFPFAKVEYLDFINFDFTPLEEEDKLKLHSYALPLLGVFDELIHFSEIKKNLDIHKKQLSQISFLKRIDFISIFLIILWLGLTVFSVQTYIDRNKKIETLKSQLARLENVKQIPPEILSTINHLNEYSQNLNDYNSKFESVSRSQLWWTDKLLTIDLFNPAKNKMWLTSINVDDSLKMKIKGLSIDRSRIPEFMKILGNAELNGIYIHEIRGKKVFQFELITNIK